MDGVERITRSRGQAKPDYLEYRDGSGGTVEIWDIAVVSERRKGVGTSMVMELVTRCLDRGVKRVYAVTRAENRVAQEFYRSLGFHPEPLYDFYGVKDENGKATVDAVMYIKRLDQL